MCNDYWAHPNCTPMPDTHLVQQLSRMGAKVIFHAVNGSRGPNASPRARYHHNYLESNLLLRARAAAVWVVSVDNCHPLDLPCATPSGVVTSEGLWAYQAPPQGEHLFVCDIELPG